MTPYYQDDHATLYNGNCLAVLESLPGESVNCCVTSPPYWGLRDYGTDSQLGLESTPDEFVANLVDVFREVRRVLRDDGTVWLNLGDSYAASSKGSGGTDKGTIANGAGQSSNVGSFYSSSFDLGAAGLKPKDLCGIPWRVAFALQADGWYLRQDIIWNKPNPMPESVRDRCTKAHEYIFLLTKNKKYYYDNEAIKEDTAESSKSRLKQDVKNQVGSDRVPFKTNGTMKAVGKSDKRNKRSVWTITTKPFRGAHFAVFPPALITPCILAGCPKGGVVLDPFNGSGTTGEVAHAAGRKYIGVELTAEYCDITLDRWRKHRVGQDMTEGLDLFTEPPQYEA